MGTEKSRRKFLGGAGAAVLASGLSAKAFSGESSSVSLQKSEQGRALHPFGFVMHGGAGTIERRSMTPERERAYREKLTEALLAGFNVLSKGGAGLDAVTAAITVLEDSPLFNAGKGAVFTSAGTNELDASIMDGKTLRAGAVAGVKRVKNPLMLARAVMEKSPHVMMVGEGAEAFAAQVGLQLVEPRYFFTEDRYRQLQRQKDAERKTAQPRTSGLGVRVPDVPLYGDEKFGTVGAVCLDRAGTLTAGTSTGGVSNKKFGRVGDSPIIGAGTYANNQTCAVSATGTGEYFIRSVVAHDISAMMQYGGKSLKEAADAVMEKVGKLGGDGGLIALDRNGNFATPFNTSGMYRGWVGPEGKPWVEIYRD